MHRHGAACTVALGHAPHQKVQCVLGSLAAHVVAHHDCTTGVLGGHGAHQQVGHVAQQVLGLVLVVHALLQGGNALALWRTVKHAHRKVHLPHRVDVAGAHGCMRRWAAQLAGVQAALVQERSHALMAQRVGQHAAVPQHLDGSLHRQHLLAAAVVVQHGTGHQAQFIIRHGGLPGIAAALARLGQAQGLALLGHQGLGPPLAHTQSGGGALVDGCGLAVGAIGHVAGGLGEDVHAEGVHVGDAAISAMESVSPGPWSSCPAWRRRLQWHRALPAHTGRGPARAGATGCPGPR